MTSFNGNAKATEQTFELTAWLSLKWFVLPLWTKFKVTSPSLSTFVVTATLAAFLFNGKSATTFIA